MSADRTIPELYAWVDKASAGEALVATLAAVFEPDVPRDQGGPGYLEVLSRGGSSRVQSVDEARPIIRAALDRGHGVTARATARLRSLGWFTSVDVGCLFVGDSGGAGGCSLSATLGDNVMAPGLEFTPSERGLPIAVASAMLGHFVQENLEQLFLSLCAPDAHPRVKVGAYSMADKRYEDYLWNMPGWRAPLEMAATYHGERLVARDVALSWLYLHDGDRVASVLDLSLDELTARVEAAPSGATVGLSSRGRHVIKHARDEWKEPQHGWDDEGWHLLFRGPRPRFREDEDLSREQVLAVLRTPSETLLDALEAAAVPDEEWREAEKRALDAIAARQEGEPTSWVNVDHRDERTFVEEHAPYHIRRLDNGGVMIATHPYRYLWPLWSDALSLLGLRP